MKLEVVAKSPTFACGYFGPLAVTVWEGAAAPADAQAAITLLNAVAKDDEQVLMLAILGPNAPPATADVRDAISNAIRRLGPQVKAAASVVEGEGFRAAAMRGALIGMGFVVRMNYPHKIYATVGEAVAFLAGYDDRLKATVLASAVAQ